MKIGIRYQTQYAYAEAVSFSLHLFRLYPKAERHVRILSSDFQTNLDAVVNNRRDLFDNEIASVFYPERSALLQASFSAELEIEPRNAFGFLLSSHALDTPFKYHPNEWRVLSPYLDEKAHVDLPFWRRPNHPQPTIQLLTDLNLAIHENLTYERREEGDPMSPDELLQRGSGACRDFAVLLAEALRSLGLAVRMASGYLCEFGTGEKVAEGSLHAWVEVYLPGAGWVGMDPTNGTFCDHHHLTAAVGITAADIAPIVGNYFHSRSVTSQMTASLQIIPHDHS